MIKSISSDTYKAVATFLHKSFLPVRITFPRNIVPKYKNHIFNCQKYGNGLVFNNTNILTPATYMAKVLDNSYRTSYYFDLGNDNMYTLDTHGLIPTRYIYMLKDFFFKDQAIVDHNSQIKQENDAIYWSNVANECSPKILKDVITQAIKVAETQSLKINVTKSPLYSKDDWWWYTSGSIVSNVAAIFMIRSMKLYSLGNIDSNVIEKYRYHSLAPPDNGISMSYAHSQPWQEFRRYIRNENKNEHHNSKDILEVKGVDTYERTGDLSIEELVILHEALVADGANVNVSNETYYVI
jgi:hypothetical protein